MESTLKNILLAGIGAVAYTYDKGSSMVDDLVKRGELTINQGKELNEELKRKMDGAKDSCSAKDDVLTADKLKEVLNSLNLATKNDLNDLEERIQKLENK